LLKIKAEVTAALDLIEDTDWRALERAGLDRGRLQRLQDVAGEIRALLKLIPQLEKCPDEIDSMTIADEPSYLHGCKKSDHIRHAIQSAQGAAKTIEQLRATLDHCYTDLKSARKGKLIPITEMQSKVLTGGAA